MRTFYKASIVFAVMLAVAAVLVFKPRAGTGEQLAPPPPGALPRLVDLGATTCVPCRTMAPILDALREDFAGRFVVEFIDVWENPGAGEPYRMRVIPTQIFFDAHGRELFRHEGFYSREDILGKWRELGFTFEAAAAGGAVAAGPQ